MTEMGDAFREHREYVRRQKDRRRQISTDTFEEASDLAFENDMELTEKVAQTHYQLTVYQSHEPLRFWLYNLYPITRRIYSDPHHKGPFLKVRRWTFVDIVKAAIEAKKP